MSPILKNVTIIGAAGNVGKIVQQKLVESGKFNIQILRRPESASKFLAGARVTEVDLNSVDALTDALKGQDAVIALFPAPLLALQHGIIDAAVNAGVKRFIPSEFGGDTSKPTTRALPPFFEKAKVQDHLIEASKTSSLSYTFVYTGAFLDWGLENNFILDTSKYQPTIYNDGEHAFQSTVTDSIGEAVRGILELPEQTENRGVYLGDFKVSQNQLLAIAKKVAPNKPWQPKHVILDEITEAAGKRLAQGIIDFQSISPFLYRSIFDPVIGSNFQKSDNDLFGIKPYTEEFIQEVFAKLFRDRND